MIWVFASLSSWLVEWEIAVGLGGDAYFFVSEVAAKCGAADEPHLAKESAFFGFEFFEFGEFGGDGDAVDIGITGVLLFFDLGLLVRFGEGALKFIDHAQLDLSACCGATGGVERDGEADCATTEERGGDEDFEENEGVFPVATGFHRIHLRRLR